MLYLAFLWHMHQPWYLDLESGEMALPWVRLHGTKDYLDMAQILEEFPQIRVTINVTPTLLEQLEGYGQGWQDAHQRLSLKPADQLTPSEVEQLLATGFLGDPQRLIHPVARYYELMAKAKRGQSFSMGELRDLQVWSNLVWIDPRFRREIPQVAQLIRKGAQFTEEEKGQLLQVQREILGRIIPTYRLLQESGRLELSTSPWAHPILPLLWDAEIARQTNPGMSLPSEPFRFPEDVRWHLKAAVDRYTHWFGRAPQGLWPSEGALSQAVLPAIAEAGFQWVAADEELLWKSMGSGFSDRSELYRPYRIEAGERNLSLLFRDQMLSDRIGFVYGSWPEEKAVSDFIGHLKQIEQSAGSKDPPPLVVVALDGENPWESYPSDGEPFLNQLYQALSQSAWLRCCTISEYLRGYPPTASLKALAAGSWIRGEFSTWIGHEAQNKGWEELLRARRLIGPETERSIAVAQGSDWFWWLGPEHSSPQDPVFDRLFRSHLKAAYRAAGRVPPPQLEEPFKKGAQPLPVAPTGPVSPVLDGEVSSYFEWLRAAEVNLTHTGSAMARGIPFFARLWWGCDEFTGYLRLDPVHPLSGKAVRVTIEESRFQAILEINPAGSQGRWVSAQGARSGEIPLAVGKILELALPLREIGLVPGEKVEISISIEQEGGVFERYPEQGKLVLDFSVPRRETQFWSA